MTTDLFLPSAHTTLAIILGASEYPEARDFEPRTAFANSAEGLRNYFLDVLSLPADNLLDLFDSNDSPSEQEKRIGKFLTTRAEALKQSGQAAKDVIIYFVGHGGFTTKSRYHLFVRHTQEPGPPSSKLAMDSLADTIKENARNLRRFLILDSCFSGAAAKVFGSAEAEVAFKQTIAAFEEKDKGSGPAKQGTSLLCSSSKDDPSITFPGARLTAFSEALLFVLQNGDSHLTSDLLSLRTIHRLTFDFLFEHYRDYVYRPEIHSPDQSKGDVADVPFFPNISKIREQLARRVRKAEKRRARKQRIKERSPLSTNISITHVEGETRDQKNDEEISQPQETLSMISASLPAVEAKPTALDEVTSEVAIEPVESSTEITLLPEVKIPLSPILIQEIPLSLSELAQTIGEELHLDGGQIERTIQLLDEGKTIPFIARYRKEVTDNLNEVQIQAIADQTEALRALHQRKLEVQRLIGQQGNLTPELANDLIAVSTLQEVEDLYLPYHHEEETAADIAREKGLASLAEIILQQPEYEGDSDKAIVLEEYAEPFLDAEKGVETVQDAYIEACHIVAESIAEDADVRSSVRELFTAASAVSVEVVDVEKLNEVDPKGTYQQFYEFNRRITELAPHQILALNRAEHERVLSVDIAVPYEQAQSTILDIYPVEPASPFAENLAHAIDESYQHILAPSMVTEVREQLTQQAEDYVINTFFTENLRQLLLQPPLGQKRVLGIDPAERTGCKLAAVDELGNLLAIGTINLLYQQEKARQILREMLRRHKVGVIAIGNKTGSRKAEEFVREVIHNLEEETDQRNQIAYIMVSEDGATAYSGSVIARQEFPDLDIIFRGAVSIARRLQDPLAELVKIDPRSLGVGYYQHDVDKGKLAAALERVVVSCVNRVGVNVNSASIELLKYVSGISADLAGAIVEYRRQNGPFHSRKELLNVPGFNKAIYEQAAGFLKIPNGEEHLDNTFIHPESYPAVRTLLEILPHDGDDKQDNLPDLVARFRQSVGEGSEAQFIWDGITKKVGVGLPTLMDILENLEKPGLDPRGILPPPIFRDDVREIEDLREGMILFGTVRNVAPIGAFVDIGVKQDGLVYLSELADRFVKNPLEVVKVGQVVRVRVLKVDFQRSRINLSMRGIDTDQ